MHLVSVIQIECIGSTDIAAAAFTSTVNLLLEQIMLPRENGLQFLSTNSRPLYGLHWYELGSNVHT